MLTGAPVNSTLVYHVALLPAETQPFVLILLNTQQNTQDGNNSCNSQKIRDTLNHEGAFAWHMILP